MAFQAVEYVLTDFISGHLMFMMIQPVPSQSSVPCDNTTDSGSQRRKSCGSIGLYNLQTTADAHVT